MNLNRGNARSYLDYISAFSSTRGRNDILKPVIRNFPERSNYQVGQSKQRKAAEEDYAQGQSGREANAADAFKSGNKGVNAAGTVFAGGKAEANSPGGNDRGDVSSDTQANQVPDPEKNKSDLPGSGFSLDFSSNSLLNGIMLAEVLGKPRYLRKGRW